MQYIHLEDDVVETFVPIRCWLRWEHFPTKNLDFGSVYFEKNSKNDYLCSFRKYINKKYFLCSKKYLDIIVVNNEYFLTNYFM